jgi:hypothetical protein
VILTGLTINCNIRRLRKRTHTTQIEITLKENRNSILWGVGKRQSKVKEEGKGGPETPTRSLTVGVCSETPSRTLFRTCCESRLSRTRAHARSTFNAQRSALRFIFVLISYMTAVLYTTSVASGMLQHCPKCSPEHLRLDTVSRYCITSHHPIYPGGFSRCTTSLPPLLPATQQ